MNGPYDLNCFLQANYLVKQVLRLLATIATAALWTWYNKIKLINHTDSLHVVIKVLLGGEFPLSNERHDDKLGRTNVKKMLSTKIDQDWTGIDWRLWKLL
jgi:uncharacterized protein (DUF779 family)